MYQTNAKSQVACISYHFQLHHNQAQHEKQHLSAAPGEELAPPFTHTLSKK